MVSAQYSKVFFFHWLAYLNRLANGDRMFNWTANDNIRHMFFVKTLWKLGIIFSLNVHISLDASDANDAAIQFHHKVARINGVNNGHEWRHMPNMPPFMLYRKREKRHETRWYSHYSSISCKTGGSTSQKSMLIILATRKFLTCRRTVFVACHKIIMFLV